MNPAARFAASSFRSSVPAIVVLALASTGLAAEFVSSSAPLSPEAERAALAVPPGFAVQLVAAEPDIGKPVSLAFDAAGRLWVAETRTYPIEPLADKTPRDAIRILGGFGADGRATENQVFADGLVMPDAVVPHATGAIVFAVPNVTNLRDEDGDGRADRRDVLYGPFETRDMHNMANSFRRGFDGWIYGGHGIGNTSTVKGTDGDQVRLQGATFRFRPDGSRIEAFGIGQANPFGLCFDQAGNVYSSDCHSLPISELLRGGQYPAFGRPHDGLGFVPPMMQHAHGSTGLAGLCLCEDDLWPEEWRGTMLIGNVVTNRVNRDRITTAGATKTAHELPDLVVGSDPWFRPVDVQLGPDGGIYVADFYNPIIAHVEVPLDHPDRDRERGRIWRIVPLGPDGTPRLRAVPDLTKAPLPTVLAALEHPNITLRLAALNRLADLGGAEVVTAARAEFNRPDVGEKTRVATLWILERLGALEPELLAAALTDSRPVVRVHALRVLGERRSLTTDERAAVIASLRDADGLARRTAVDAVGRHPGPDAIRPLLDLRRETDAADATLIYMARKSLRDNLLGPEAWTALGAMELSPQDRRSLADVCRAVPGGAAAALVALCLEQGDVAADESADAIEFVARHADEAALARVLDGLSRLHPDDVDARAQVFARACAGLAKRGRQPASVVGGWAERLVGDLMAADDKQRQPARRATAAVVAAECRVVAAVPALSRVVADSSSDAPTRAAALRAVLTLDPPAGVDAACNLLRDPTVTPEWRGEIGLALAGLDREAARTGAVEVLCTAAANDRTRVAGGLAGSTAGADALVDAVAAGRVPADVLLDPSVKASLARTKPDDSRIAALVASLRPADQRLQAQIDRRLHDYRQGPADAVRGRAVFAARCGACHDAQAQGEKLAPGLGGVGLRGVERLCEDIVAPNRNVDHVFRMSVVECEDGRVFTGLARRDDGAQVVFADQAGKEFAIPRAEIAARTLTPTSLMPEGFGETLSPEDFNDLLAFLLAGDAAATDR